LSKRYWQPPALELRPGHSRRLQALAGLVLALSLLALWVSALPWWACSVGSLLLLLLGRLDLKSYGWTLAAGRICGLVCIDERWRVELESGERIPIFPCSSSLLLPWLIVLRAGVGASSETCNLVLAQDAYAAESWRRLQLNLRQTLDSSPADTPDSRSG
jgi:hypothetical protein